MSTGFFQNIGQTRREGFEANLNYQTPRWSAYVNQHRVKEAGFIAYARSHSESLKPVIVDDPGPNGGYYLFSERDEVCLKWIPRAE